MSTLTEVLPTLGQPNATEESKLRTVLSDIVSDYNGSLNRSNLASSVDNAFLPWTIDIDPFTTPATQTNWSTITVDAAQINGGYLKSSGAQNATIGWDLPLMAGVWAVALTGVKASDGGVGAITVDGVQASQVDFYAASTIRNVSFSAQIASFSVATTGKKRVALLMSTKDSASSGYVGYVSALTLVRTS